MEPGSSDEKLPEGGRVYGVPRLREQVLRRLADAYSENNLDLEEYEKRVRQAQEARTIEQLQKVLADFEEPRAPGPARPAGGAPEGGSPEVFFALIGDREVTVEEIESRAVNVYTVIGDARIDLTRLRGGEVLTVTSVSAIGDTKLLVPPGTNVVRRYVTLIGDFKRKKASPPPPGSPPCTVILQGFKLIGDVVVTEAGPSRK